MSDDITGGRHVVVGLQANAGPAANRKPPGAGRRSRGAGVMAPRPANGSSSGMVPKLTFNYDREG